MAAHFEEINRAGDAKGKRNVAAAAAAAKVAANMNQLVRATKGKEICRSLPVCRDCLNVAIKAATTKATTAANCTLSWGKNQFSVGASSRRACGKWQAWPIDKQKSMKLQSVSQQL